MLLSSSFLRLGWLALTSFSLPVLCNLCSVVSVYMQTDNYKLIAGSRSIQEISLV